MGRILRKIFLGAGIALVLFLAMVYFFGGRTTVSVAAPSDGHADGEVAGEFDEKNLTEAISTSLAAKIIDDNPEGPETAGDGTMLLDIEDPEEFVAAALASEAAQFSPDDLIEPVLEENVIVLEKDSTEAASAYIQQMLGVLKNNFKTPITKSASQAELFDKLSAERTAGLRELYKLKATPGLAELHRDLIAVVGTQRNIFDALAQYEADPMKALLAAQFQASIEADLKGITADLIEYITDHNLGG